jgi:tetratricopeptide (TPR) repeat protein
LQKQGRLKDAWDAYQALLKKEPKNFTAVHNMGLIAVQMKSHQMAIDLFNIAKEIDPASAKTYNNLANAQFAMQDFSAALAGYNKAISLDLKYGDALKNRGMLFLGDKQYKKAADDFALATKVDSRNWQLHAYLANTYVALKQFDDALKSYQKALKLNPQSPVLLNNIGVLLCSSKSYKKAVEHFGKALTLQPAYAEALNNRAAAYSAMRLYPAAIKDYDHALSLAPGYLDAKEGKAKAISYLSKA